MPAHSGLETPADASDLYLARQEDELADFIHRPIFTGDVLRLPDDRAVVLVQHPCAMRRGPSLVDKLLVTETREHEAPADWGGGHFRRAFLPGLPCGDLAVEFDRLDVVSRSEIGRADRIAILSEQGVNLLVQRWIHHNSRVVVPTITIHEQTTGPYEEADLTGEGISELIAAGMSADDALQAVDAWLGQPHPGGSTPRRELLDVPQSRSIVRATFRQFLRDR